MTRIAVGGTSPTGLRWPHPVNGRVLTAVDLRTGQEAVRGRDRWLGLAVGSGVAVGLEVNGTPGSSVLQVSPGTGVSPGGIAVHLDTTATIDLTAVVSTAPVTGELFAECRPASTSSKAPSAGAYLLVASPASRFEGKVAVAGAPGASVPTPCTSRWQAEDVAFAAIRLDGFTAKTTAQNRRNLLAHFCFGSGHLADLALSGFVSPVPWRGLAGLADLTPCDLALAVFDWDGSALVFVDRWSARRRPVRPPATVALAAVVGDDRSADGEARFLQFQDQLAGLLATPAGRSVRALDVFPLLPPAGLVPIDPVAGVRHLLAGQAELAPAGDAAEVATVGAAVAAAGSGRRSRRDELTDLLAEARGSSLGGSRLGQLGKELLELQQQIDALRHELDALGAVVTGARGVPRSAEAVAAGRRLAGKVVAGLIDVVGDGVDPVRFFAGVPVRWGVVDRETVDFTIRRSWPDEALDLGAGAVLNVYFVLDADGETVAPYVLFAKRQRGVRWITTTPKAPER